MATVSDNVKGAGQTMQSVGGTLSKAVTAPLLGVAGAALKVGMDFDAQMSKVAALSGATGAEFDALRETAKHLGATTRFSATQAAEGMEYMALAGWDAQQTMAAMPGLLQLAAAAGMDLGRASDIVTDTMSAFGIEASQATYVADQFAAAQSKSNTNVNQLGEALKMAAPQAKAAGMSLAETNAALGVLADSGLKGSIAGTTLNAMLRDLKGNVEDGRVSFGDFSVEVYDAEGRMRAFGDIIADVEAGTAGMTDAQRDAALGAVFQAQSLRGVNIMLETGTERYRELNEAIVNSHGLAAEQAAIMEDNLAGAVTTLKSRFEDLMIQLSDVLTPIVREQVVPAFEALMDKISGLIGWFANLDAGTQRTILIIAGIAAAIGPVLVVLGTLAIGIGQVVGAVGSIAGAVGKLAGLFGLLTNPIGLVIVAIGLLVGAFILAYTHSETFRDIVHGAIDAIMAVVEAVFPVVQEIIETAFNAILAVAEVVWPVLQSVIETAVEIAQTVIEAAFNAILAVTEAVWPVIQSAVETAVTAVQTVIEAVFPVVQAAVERAFEAVKAATERVWPVVEQIIGTAAEIIGTLVEKYFELIQAVTERVFNAVLAVAEAVWPVIQGVIETTMGVIETVVTTVLDIILGIWEKTGDQILSHVEQIWETIQSVIEGTLNVIAGILETIMGVISGDWDRAWEGIKQIADGVWTALKSLIDLALSSIKTAITIGLGVIETLFDTAWEGIKRVVSRGADRVVDFMRELPGRIVSALGNLGSLLWDLGAQLIQGLIDGIRSKISALTSTLSGITDKIPSWKGPPAKDRRLLIPTGRWIMEGLDSGIQAGERDIEHRLGHLTGRLGDLTLNARIERGGGPRSPELHFHVDQLVATDRREAERSAGDLGWGVAAALRSRGVAL